MLGLGFLVLLFRLTLVWLVLVDDGAWYSGLVMVEGGVWLSGSVVVEVLE